MNSVTSKFNKYDLSEICSKYISHFNPNHPVPPRAGQSSVNGTEVFEN